MNIKNKLSKSLMLLVLAIFQIAAADTPAEPQVHVWPRNSEVNIPTAIQKFIFLEIPSCNEGENLCLKIQMPKGMVIKNFPRSFSSMALPRENKCIYPQTFSIEKDIHTLSFPAAGKKDESHKFLCMTIQVDTVPGDYTVNVTGFINNRKTFSKNIPIKIHPKLNGMQPSKMTIAAYDYAGLEEAYIPVLMNMMKQACSTRSSELPQLMARTFRT